MERSWNGGSPTWIDSLVFFALMSGPPKFRDRDVNASLVGAVDWVVLLHVLVWLCGGLWVFARLYPTLVRRGTIPSINAVQVAGLLLIAGLCLSILKSPGVLLTAFTLGQFGVMLGFAWLFTERHGPSTYLRHLFAGIVVLTVMLVIAALLNPEMVIAGGERFRGERIASTGGVAALGLVFCLSNVPAMKSSRFWLALTVFAILLATSRMRTAYFAMLVYLAVGWMFGKRLPVRALVPWLAAIVLALLMLEAFQPTAAYVVRDTKSIGTMSDRIPLWRHISRAVFRDDPVIGMGYFAASRIVAPQHNPRLGNAHSVFFEYLLGGGLIGAGLYLILCASLVWCAVRVLSYGSGQAEAVACAGLLATVLVLGITSSEGTHAGPVGFTFWSLTALLPAIRRQALGRRMALTHQVSRRRPLSTAGAATGHSA